LVPSTIYITEEYGDHPNFLTIKGISHHYNQLPMDWPIL